MITPSAFATMVRGAFAFLEHVDNAVSVEEEAFAVIYRLRKIHVAVKYDARRSMEMDVSVAQPNSTEAFGISELLRVMGEDRLAGETRLVQACDDNIEARLRWLARLFEEHAVGCLKGDAALFRNLRRQRHAESLQTESDRELAQARMRAEDAWLRKDYAEVARILGVFAALLSPAEVKRVEYCRKRQA